ncbi:MAG TPA: thioredoxin family protein [Verrucomicrobiae bacterium]|nr:thioredoxin family protein [Verrucomicrobiae bacterium]
MKLVNALLLTLSLATASAAEHPYNETVDAKAEIKQTLAATANTPIVLVFGANWCPDCLALDKAMTHGASAGLLAHDFRIIKVDVGHTDKNKDVAESYGVPLEKGIPTVAIISPKNQVLYVTKEGELAKARKMSDDGIYQFFKRVTASAKTKE